MKNVPLSAKRYLYLFNGVLILLLLGVGYTWSIFVGPLEAWFGWSRTQTSLAFTLNILSFSLGVILCGMLGKRYHFERVAQFAACLLAAGFILTTRITQVWQLYITYSLLCGTAVGMMYSAIISTLPLWFRDKTGMATGILIMGYALSTTILGPVCQQLLAARGWQTTFFLLGTADLIVMGLGGFFVRLPRSKELAELPKAPESSEISAHDVTTKEMLRSPSFYFLFVYFVTQGSCGLTVINHMSPLLTSELGMTAAAAALAVSAGSLVNGFGRLACGVIFDKIGSVATARFIATSNLVILVLLYLAYRSEIAPLVVILLCFVLFFFGGDSSTIPSITRGLYGEKNFSGNYSIVSLQSLFSGIPASIAGMLQTAVGTYEYMFYLLCLCALCATAGAWGMGIRKKGSEQK